MLKLNIYIVDYVWGLNGCFESFDLQMLCAEDFKLPVRISFMNNTSSIVKNIYNKTAIFVINNTNDLK